MVPELGKLALLLALALCIITPIMQLSGRPLRSIKYLWGTNFLLIFGTFICLVYSYIISDFTVLNVWNNSHTNKPLIYKITGSWGNHEGSMLLWLLSISFFSLAFALFAEGDKEIIKYTLIFQALLLAFFISFVIFASNPFERIFPAPVNGQGLNPILQDIGLAFHPPMLYLGYVGFSIAFSAGVAGLLLGNADASWAKLMRPWVLLSWSFLTLGIGLGSWWAYRELGWGGYWFWDPVENASLMPWLTATALLHSLIVTEKTGNLKSWSVLLAIITFALSLIGTFIVRSGIITSVHSFAQDPKRGLFILIFLTVLIGFSLLLYAFRAHKLTPGKPTSLLSREIFLLFNNLFLVVAAATVVIGTLYPTILELFTGDKISVGAPYFNTTMPPIAIGLLVIAAIGSDLNWNQTKPKSVLKKQALPFITSLVIAVITYHGFEVSFGYELIGITFGAWFILVMVSMHITKKPKLSSTFYSMVFAHVGIGIVIIAISANSALQEEIEKPMSVGEVIQLKNYKIKFLGMTYDQGKNFYTRIGKFELNTGGKYLRYMHPETRLFPVEKQQTTESAVLHNIFYDLYLAIGETDGNERVMLRAYYRPMIGWIWFGCMLIFIGGIYGLTIKFLRRTWK